MPSAKRPARTIQLIRRTDALVRSALEAALLGFDLTPGQHSVLAMLWGSSGLSASQLARRAAVRPQSINEVIVLLADKGLVEREEDPENRRVLRVRLTARGRRTLRSCDAEADRVEAELFAGVPEAEVTALRTLLTGILDRQPATPGRAQPVQPDLFERLR